MAVDEAAARHLSEALGLGTPLVCRPMFGGLGWFLDGHMVCGALSRSVGGGAVFRVGPANAEAALGLPGALAFSPTGRPMRGWVRVTTGTLEDEEAVCADLLAQALGHAAALPPKG